MRSTAERIVNNARKTLLSWSSGKDSAWALHVLRRSPDLEVAGLVTVINVEFDRVAMHAVRRELVEAQARAVGIELWIVEIPNPCSDAQYGAAMTTLVNRARHAGISAMGFGDLFLEDVRAYRERMLAGSGLEPLFPLWDLDTRKLAHDMLAAGLKARVTCIDPKSVDPSLAGREWDLAFLEQLSQGADPCGENGEFHTFAYDGPMFSRPIAIRSGEVLEREGFVFADLVAA